MGYRSTQSADSWPSAPQTRAVASRSRAVTVGLASRLPPLSVGGALRTRPWLRFHIPLIARARPAVGGPGLSTRAGIGARGQAIAVHRRRRRGSPLPTRLAQAVDEALE